MCIRDRLGTAVSFNHDGSLLAIGSTGDNGKNNNKNNSGAVRLFKFMNSGSVVSAATGTPTYIGSIGQDYDYLDTSDSSVHTVTLANGDRFGNSVAFDKDADRLAVSYWDQSVSGESKVRTGAVNLYTLTDNLASATYIGTIGNGYTGSKDLDLGSSLDSGDKFGEGIDLNETGNRLVMSGMMADGNNNSKSNSGEVMPVSYTHLTLPTKA